MSTSAVRALLLSVALLLGLVAALVAGILARLGHAPYPDAAARGGVAFVMATTTTVVLFQAAGLLESS